MADAVNHPQHYGGEDNPYEAIKVIEAWGLGFSLGNAVKYISRAGLKDPAKELEDLQKAAWYLNREIENRKVVVVALQSQAEEAQNAQPTVQPMFHGSIVKVGETPLSEGHLSTD